jgi:hypothetical protein
VTTNAYLEEYGEEYVGMSKETAIEIILSFSEYEDKEQVANGIKRTNQPPYLSVPPIAYLKYKNSLTKKLNTDES